MVARSEGILCQDKLLGNAGMLFVLIPASINATEVKNKITMKKIVVLDGYAMNPGDLSFDGIEALGDCTVYDFTKPDEVLERAKDAEILLSNKTRLTAETIAAFPLSLIHI